MATESPVRCEVLFRGHVQGVGFRHTTTVVVSNYPLTGYVINLRDGGVRMMVEGPRTTVSLAIRRVVDAMGPYITDHKETWLPATGEFRGFEIRHEGP
jgi:acylphosphatase